MERREEERTVRGRGRGQELLLNFQRHLQELNLGTVGRGRSKRWRYERLTDRLEEYIDRAACRWRAPPCMITGLLEEPDRPMRPSGERTLRRLHEEAVVEALDALNTAVAVAENALGEVRASLERVQDTVAKLIK